jgi:23S rRNA pseudouridine1911/1915/1917 synthase
MAPGLAGADAASSDADPSAAAAEFDPETGLDAETRVATVSAALHGERLDKALVAMAPEFSRSHVQQLLEAGHARVDGEVASTASRRVRSGQQLQLTLVPTDESRSFRPQAMALQLLFEDEHLLVLDKPAGLVVHPAPGNWSGPLLNGLLAHHAGAAQLPRAGIVHRLDKDTSGLMLVGKSLPGVTALSRDIADRSVHRRYLALAHGVPHERSFTLDAPIGRDPQVRVRMAVVAGGRPSRTDVQLLASHGGISAFSCRLHTGRTHQIRVHMAHAGLPLVGDVLYGGKPALAMARQALHATALRLHHPISRQPLEFHAPPPADLASAWLQVTGEAAADAGTVAGVTR